MNLSWGIWIGGGFMMGFVSAFLVDRIYEKRRREPPIVLKE